jgi:hypothetical protein
MIVTLPSGRVGDPDPQSQARRRGWTGRDVPGEAGDAAGRVTPVWLLLLLGIMGSVVTV